MKAGSWRLGTVTLLTVAACTSPGPAAPTSAPTTTTTTTTTTVPTTTTSTGTATTGAPLPTVDWDLIARSPWLVNGPEGILSATGELVWRTNPAPGEASIARDQSGGFAWTDRDGLWWLPARVPRPVLVATDLPGRLYGVSLTSVGPVAHLEGPVITHLALETGEETAAPDHPRVRLEGAFRLPVITADNDLTATVTAPEVVFDDEGQPVEVTAPARLVVTDGADPVVDVPVGGFYSPWVRLHDFDGQRVVLSRGPFEPALPQESFFVADLTCGTCLHTFYAAASTVALVGPDSEWDGSAPDHQPGVLTGAWLGSDAGVDRLTDGTYLGFLARDRLTSKELALDLAVWFSGPDADAAARADGDTDVPVSDDFYIRNDDPTLIDLPIADDVAVTSVWFDYDADPDLANDPIGFSDLLQARQFPEDDVRATLWTDPWWVTITDGRVVRLDEQYVP